MLEIFLAIVGCKIGLLTIFITIKLYNNSRVAKVLDSLLKVEIVLRNFLVANERDRCLIIPHLLDILFELQDVLKRLETLKNQNIEDGIQYLNSLQFNLNKYWSKKEPHKNHVEILNLFKHDIENNDDMPKQLMVLRKRLNKIQGSIWWY